MRLKSISALLLSAVLMSVSMISAGASSYSSLSDMLSQKSVNQGLSIGDYGSLKSMLPDLSSSFSIMSQSDLDAQMNTYMSDIQSKYQSALSSAQSKASSNYNSSASGIQSRADQIKSGINPDTGEAYSDYIANNITTYDFDQYMSDTSSSMQNSLEKAKSLAGTPENDDSAYQQAVSNFESSYGASLTNAANVAQIYDDIFEDKYWVTSDGTVGNIDIAINFADGVISGFENAFGLYEKQTEADERQISSGGNRPTDSSDGISRGGTSR